jgi:hypothetical protein
MTPRPPAASDKEAHMNTTKLRISGLALLAAAAFALLLAPIHAHADTGVTDRHEIPTFVLERIELATGANGSLG